MMKSVKLAALASVAAFVSLAPMAKADQWDKKTILTVKEQIQLPNMVLQPGVYTFKLLESQSDRHIVQVFDKDGMHLVTTILAIPNYRLQPTGHSDFTFWETPAGQAPAMRAWFYPGDNFGQEFAYPKNMSQQIASSAKMTVPTTAAATNDDYKTAAVTATNGEGSSSDLDKSAYTAPVAVAAVEPTPAPVPEPVAATAPAPTETVAQAPPPMPDPIPAAQELPQTGSSAPLVGLIGLASLGAFFALKPRSVR